MRTMSVANLQWDLHDVESRIGFRDFALRCLGYFGAWLVLVELFAIVGSSGYFEISAGQASAARLLGVATGAPVELRVF